MSAARPSELPTDEMRSEVERIFDSQSAERSEPILKLLAEIRVALNRGLIRAAEVLDGVWRVNEWVKKAILLHAKFAELADISPLRDRTQFDYDTLPPRYFGDGEWVRIGAGTVVRDGCYLGNGVTVMPQSAIAMGAWLGNGTVIDSHVTIGVCCQIEDRVQVSCGTNLGGVIEPLSSLPVVIMNDVTIGGNCGIYGSVHIGEGAVIAAGTIMTGMSRVYDFRRKTIFNAAPGEPLFIPPFAVVLPGARPLTKGAAADSGLMLHVPVIVGRRDEVDLESAFLAELMS